MLGERGNVDSVVSDLWRRRHTSPTHLLRAVTTELSRRRLEEGLAEPLNLEESLHACSLVEDPRARTSFTYAAGYSLAQRGEYRIADAWLTRMWTDVENYDLAFAQPLGIWTRALIRLGMRRFGEAERLLQTLEDSAAAHADDRHALNARILRARLLLQTGKPVDAIRLTSRDGPAHVYPSWHGEYLATRAMALAATGETDSAEATVQKALKSSRMVEVRMLAVAARAISDATNPAAADRLMAEATKLGVWDPVVCAVRTSGALADTIARSDVWRDRLEHLYAASSDLGLARRQDFARDLPALQLRFCPHGKWRCWVLSRAVFEILRLPGRCSSRSQPPRCMFGMS